MHFVCLTISLAINVCNNYIISMLGTAERRFYAKASQETHTRLAGTELLKKERFGLAAGSN